MKSQRELLLARLVRQVSPIRKIQITPRPEYKPIPTPEELWKARS